MRASRNGHLKVVRTLLEAGADVNAKAKDKVRNQMMMMMMMMVVVINDEDRDVCRL